MPKVNYLGTTKKDPPIDWLKAAILERMDAKGIGTKKLAEMTGIGYSNLRQMMNKSPWEWKQEQRQSVCKVLNLKIEIVPTQICVGN